MVNVFEQVLLAQSRAVGILSLDFLYKKVNTTEMDPVNPNAAILSVQVYMSISKGVITVLKPGYFVWIK